VILCITHKIRKKLIFVINDIFFSIHLRFLHIQSDSRRPFVKNFLISQNRINIKIGSLLHNIIDCSKFKSNIF
jgi:hypothetical protein